MPPKMQVTTARDQVFIRDLNLTIRLRETVMVDCSQAQSSADFQAALRDHAIFILGHVGLTVATAQAQSPVPIDVTALQFGYRNLVQENAALVSVNTRLASENDLLTSENAALRNRLAQVTDTLLEKLSASVDRLETVTLTQVKRRS